MKVKVSSNRSSMDLNVGDTLLRAVLNSKQRWCEALSFFATIFIFKNIVATKTDSKTKAY